MADIFDWSTTASSNTTCDGININTGMPVGNVDNALRSIMALVRNSFSIALEGFLNGTTALPITSGGTGAPDAATARTNLGLGSMAAQAANAVAITGGSVLLTGPAGYTAGAGGTVTQAGSKLATVAIDKICGQITTNSSFLPAGGAVAFSVSNALVAPTDTIIAHVRSGAASPGGYRVEVCNVGVALFDIVIQNTTGSGLSEALVINFSVIKAVNV